MYRAGLGYVVYVFGYEIGSGRTHYCDCALPQSRAASVELVSCALSASQASLASAPARRSPPGRWRGVGKAGARCAQALRIPRPPYPGEFANLYFPPELEEVGTDHVSDHALRFSSDVSIGRMYRLSFCRNCES